MDIALAKRVQKVKPSPTLAVAAKAAQMKAQGLDIIGLGTGEPDFDTPQHIKLAAISAIEAGDTKYTAVDGIVELKEAVKNKFKRDNELDYQLNQILVSVGVNKAAITSAKLTLILAMKSSSQLLIGYPILTWFCSPMVFLSSLKRLPRSVIKSMHNNWSKPSLQKHE